MKHVLVVGDAIQDSYEEYQHTKFCPDDSSLPVNVLKTKQIFAGGAANVANNISSLTKDCEVTVHLLSSVTDDFLDRFSNKKIRYWANDNVMPIKTRISIDGKKVGRFDCGSSSLIKKSNIDFIFDRFIFDLIVISDYGLGAINDEVVSMLPKHKMLVDTKSTELSKYNGAFLLKLNNEEWKNVCSVDDVPERFFKYMVVTHGKNGAELTTRISASARKSITHKLQIKSYDVEEVDVCGCGDTFIAGMAASFLSNDDPFTAMQFGNAAAASVVTKKHIAVASLEETRDIILNGKYYETKQ